MKSTLSLFLLMLVIISCGNKKSESTVENKTTSDKTVFYLIRHAEKDRTNPNNEDPHLNDAGLERAEKWKTELEDIEFDAIYSTDFHRTRETAAPLARHNNLDITLYDPAVMSDPNFIKENQGKTVLIVGHSNTTPMFANAILGKEKYPHMQDNNNEDLYIVTIENGRKTSQLRKVN